MFKVAVLGAGEQAQGVAHYLTNDNRVRKFVCYDNDDMRLWKIKKYLGNKGQAFQLDATNSHGLNLVLKEGEFHGVINTLPYALLPETTQTTIMAGLPGVDLGQATNEQESLRNIAIKNNVSYTRACGIAPGFISDVGFYVAQELDVCRELQKYAGGLLQKPKGKLGHASFFSVPGLYYEYVMTPEVIMLGEKCPVTPLASYHPQTFILPNGCVVATESAITAEAFEPDLDLWRGIDFVHYATLRHKGFDHFNKVRDAIRNMQKDECIDWLWRNLVPKEGEKDMMLVRVIAIGEKNGVNTTIQYDIMDFFDETTGLSAMQRCTAFPATETLLQMLTHPERWPIGFPYHERHVNMSLMKQNLFRHGIVITRSVTPDLS